MSSIKHLLFLAILCCAPTLFAQKLTKGILLDSVTKKAVPFATVSVNNNYGVLSNERGEFKIFLKEVEITNQDSLYISCLGYDGKRLPLTVSDSLNIFLSPKNIELDEVVLTNKTYSLDEIIKHIQDSLESNYDNNFIKSTLFFRESNINEIQKSEIKIKTSSIPEFNQGFIDSVMQSLPKYSDSYTEILGNLYGKNMPGSENKLNIIKASELYDKSQEISMEAYEERFNDIIKQNVKRDSYFKIKSGIFSTKEDMDSTFYDNPEAKETEALLEEQKKKEENRKNNFLKYRKSMIARMNTQSFIYEDTDLNFIHKAKKYRFELLDYTFLNNDFVYKISFRPKGSADYKGIMYVNTEDFAILRLDFENVKSVEKFNLLGLSYNLFLKKGTYIYSKNNNDKYSLKFAELTESSKMGIKRPLKIIEKNKNVKGRRKQNELACNLHFIVEMSAKKELVVFENSGIDEVAFSDFEEKAKVTPVYLPSYDPEFWMGYNVIEPNQAIKEFKSIE
ncbi:MAG: hypothetical protein BM564_12620 [Bacteroidetes bacterium MedPE-SWsnd-G2]|nr:MAG: hypothetical protein BM564_12620 [Bacteroidetes bacterium MedPE-SWsnd-G2]